MHPAVASSSQVVTSTRGRGEAPNPDEGDEPNHGAEGEPNHAGVARRGNGMGLDDPGSTSARKQASPKER